MRGGDRKETIFVHARDNGDYRILDAKGIVETAENRRRHGEKYGTQTLQGSPAEDAQSLRQKISHPRVISKERSRACRGNGDRFCRARDRRRARREEQRKKKNTAGKIDAGRDLGKKRIGSSAQGTARMRMPAQRKKGNRRHSGSTFSSHHSTLKTEEITRGVGPYKFKGTPRVCNQRKKTSPRGGHENTGGGV